jgi:hypothetical protein
MSDDKNTLQIYGQIATLPGAAKPIANLVIAHPKGQEYDIRIAPEEVEAFASVIIDTGVDVRNKAALIVGAPPAPAEAFIVSRKTLAALLEMAENGRAPGCDFAADETALLVKIRTVLS